MKDAKITSKICTIKNENKQASGNVSGFFTYKRLNENPINQNKTKRYCIFSV